MMTNNKVSTANTLLLKQWQIDENHDSDFDSNEHVVVYDAFHSVDKNETNKYGTESKYDNSICPPGENKSKDINQQNGIDYEDAQNITDDKVVKNDEDSKEIHIEKRRQL